MENLLSNSQGFCLQYSAQTKKQLFGKVNEVVFTVIKVLHYIYIYLIAVNYRTTNIFLKFHLTKYKNN